MEFIFFLALVGSEFLNYVAAQGGAGPMGSISDYYDMAFGNPFLGYWKNPGNRNPFGTVQVQGTGYGDMMNNNPYQANSLLGDRPGPIAPSYAYDRLPNTFEQPGAYGGGYNMPVAAGLGGRMPYMGGGYPPPMYGGGYGGYGGYGMGYGRIIDSRTPADRALQDLLPSTYLNKPFYP